jgi:dTMP kinase
MARGRFITFEGIDGVGKTKQCRLLCQALDYTKIPFTLTNEPNGLIRTTLLGADWTGLEELWLIAAGRSRHVRQVIQPALDVGRWVICDRFMITTLAYQGGGRGVLFDTVHSMAQSIRPDLAIVLDAPVSVARERRASTGKALDRMERLGDDFYERARNVFLSEALGSGVALIDATRSVEYVHRQVVNTVAVATRVHLEPVA